MNTQWGKITEMNEDLKPLRLRVAKELEEIRGERAKLEERKAQLNNELKLRVARTIQDVFMHHTASKYLKPPEELSQEIGERVLNEMFHILKASLRVLRLFRLRMVYEPLYDEHGRQVAGYVDRDRGIMFVDARDIRKSIYAVAELFVHEFLHLRWVHTAEPVELAFNQLMDSLDREASKHPESWSWMKPLIEEGKEYAKIAVDRNYELTEPLVNFIVRRVGPMAELNRAYEARARAIEMEEEMKERESKMRDEIEEELGEEMRDEIEEELEDEGRDR